MGNKYLQPVLLTLLLVIASPPAIAQQIVYRCEDGEERAYVSKPKPNAECAAVGVYAGPRWVLVTKSQAGDEVRVDKETIHREKGTVSAWVQYFHLQKKLPAGSAVRTMQREVMNCSAATVGVSSFVVYDADSRVIDQATYLGVRPSPVVPDSIQEATWQYLCKGTLPKE